jgi:signal transduction histidine kinase
MRRGLTGRMVVASGLLAVIVGGAFAIVLFTITELRGTTELRRETRDALVAADDLEKRIIDLETGLRGFVITRDESFLQPAEEAGPALPGSARALERLAADEPIQFARVGRIVRAMNGYIRDYALPLVEAVRRNDASVRSVERTAAGKRRVDALRAGLASFRQAERVRISARDADVDQAARRATAASAVGVAGSIVLILVFAGYLTRVIVQPLRRAATMADRLAGGDLSARMRETDIAEIGALERSFNVMAGSLKKSRDKLAALLAEQAALRRVATLVARETSPEDVFAAVAEELQRLFDARATLVGRLERDGTVSIVATSGTAPAELSVGSRLNLESGLVVTKVIRTGRSARVDDYRHVPGSTGELTRRLGIRCSVAVPIMVGGSVWGALGAATEREGFPADAEQRLAAFTELVATAISNIQARSDLSASRARLVAATDEERRRVVRDLHDGAQQRLVHTVIILKLARRALEPNQAPGSELVDEALEHAERANVELRELAHGILPAVLTQGGLRAGVDALASRTPVPVTKDVSVDRLPAPVEATAYFVVAEALTNVAKHAQAGHAEVKAWIEDHTLAIHVRDDGIGGAQADGTGLVGIADRLAALDGQLRIESPPDGGTLVAAAIPLPG